MNRRSSHSWIPYLSSRRQRVARFERRLLLTRAAFGDRRYQFVSLLAVYLLACLVTFAFGFVTLAGFAILPVVLVPPVGLLIYWLVWKEFHH
jgi:hypothetical protein